MAEKHAHIDVAAIVRDITKQLPNAVWRVESGQQAFEFPVYRGTVGDWRIFVVCFQATEDTKGYDGTGMRGHIVLHLPVELAKCAYELAVAAAN